MSRRGHRVLALAATGLLTVALAACGDDDKGGSASNDPQIPALSIDGLEYAYTLTPQSVTGTTARINFNNPGKEYHMLELGLLKPGKTVADVTKALASQDQNAFAAVFVNPNGDALGQPQVLAPGTKSSTTVTSLQPGTYAALCFLSAPDGTPHFAKGMVGSFTVTAASEAPDQPDADATVDIDEKGFSSHDAFKDGKGTLKVVNKGTRMHSLAIIKLNGSTTFEAADTFFDETLDSGKVPPANPPAEIVGGMSRLDTGKTAYLHLDLSPGRYAVIDVESVADEDEADEYYKANPTTSRLEFEIT